MGEVREADYAAAGDAHNFLEDADDIDDRLQSLRKQCHVEGLVGDCGEALVDVCVDRVEAAADRLRDFRRVTFDAKQRCVISVAKNRKKFAVAAAEVDDARAFGHQS